MTLEVVEPGLLTTVQDAGRPAWTHLGVPVGGACDRWSLAVANRLLDQPPDTPALEATLVGPTLAVRAPTVIALAGADLAGIELASSRPLLPGRTYRLDAGATIAFPGRPGSGARLYIALPGGIEVPLVLGSASTLLAAALGGLDGRALAVGDRVTARSEPDPSVANRVWPGSAIAPSGRPGTLRVVRGPHADLLGEDVLGALLAQTWAVDPASDRMAARLDGPPLAIETNGELLSHGVPAGAVQVPPDGRPIILLADHQTTGGYPVAAVVTTADLDAAGQLPPGAAVRFEEVAGEVARADLVSRRNAWEAASSALGEAAGWDTLWRSAGA